jgi:hypothetical protein
MSSIVFLQFSDIHFGTESNDQQEFVLNEFVPKSVRRSVPSADAVVSLFTGDITWSGKQHEFEVAMDMVKAVRQEVLDVIPTSNYAEIYIPGNHDCDRDMHDDLIKIVTSNTTHLHGAEDSTISKCLEAQTAYRNFVKQADSSSVFDVYSVTDKLYTKHRCTLAGQHFEFLLFNSAWASTKNEKAGTVCFPDWLHIDTSETPVHADTITCAAIHHPFAWYDQVTRNGFIKSIESYSNLIFAGHEHEKDAYNKTRTMQGGVTYLESPALLDVHGRTRSGLNVARISTESDEISVTTLRATKSGNIEEAEVSTYPIAREQRKVRGGLVFSPQHRDLLNEIGNNISHPTVPSLRLRDLYVFPTLKRISHDQPKTTSKTIAGGKCREELLQQKEFVVSAYEKHGKTSLCKMMCMAYAEEGFSPLLLHKPTTISADRQKLHQQLSALVSQQYAHTADEYFQIPREKRVVIIDDFDQYVIRHGTEDDFIDSLRSHFGTIMIVSLPSLELREVIDSKSSKRIRSSFAQFTIQEMGHRDRNRLVEKWEALKGANPAGSGSFVNTCARIENTLSTLLGKNLLPHLPMFILILMQQIEEKVGIESDQSTLGRLYDFLITGSLLTHATQRVSAEDASNYLAELAAYIYFSDRHPKRISSTELENWTNEYCKTWNAAFSLDRITAVLEKADMLTKIEDYYIFKFDYVFQFFVAKSITNALDEGIPLAQDRVKTISRRIYDKDAANIMVFLCYQSRHPVIISSVIEELNAIFVGQEEFNFDDLSDIRTKYDAAVENLDILKLNPSEARKQLLEKFDESKGNPTSEGPLKHPGKETVSNDFIHDYQASYMAVHIAGQLLRSYHGTLRGPRQEEMLKACYSAGFRTLGAVANLISTNSDQIAHDFVTATLEANEDVQRHDVISSVQGRISGLLDRNSFAIIKGLATSTGSRKLEVTTRNVIDSANCLTYKMVGLASHLDHHTDYPTTKVEELWQDTASQHQVRAILQDILFLDLHLYDRGYKIIQRITEKMKSNTSSEKFLVSKIKKKAPGKKRG